jgi:translation initiation factor IF-2
MNLDLSQIPELPDWILVAEAARLLGVSKQAVHLMIQQGQFKQLHRMKQAAGTWIYVLNEDEVQKLAAVRSARQSEELVQTA